MSPLPMVSAIAILMLASTTNGFAPIQSTRSSSSLSAVAYMPPATPVEINVATQTLSVQQQHSQLNAGVENFLAASSIESSSQALSLKDRPPPPTKEEIAAKQRNFNFWFWGGGFVAPFIATVFYFGPKFWTK